MTLNQSQGVLAGHRASSSPTLGAVVPLFGDVTYMRECIRSLQLQTRPFDLVVLVDDATYSAEVKGLMEEAMAADERWIALHLDENLGIVGATNAGIAACPTDYIAFIDCDDVLHAEAAEVVMDHVRRNQVDFLASRYATFTDDYQQSVEIGLADLLGVYPTPQHLILEHMYLSHLKVARASFLERVGRFQPGTDGVQDWHLAVDAVLSGTVQMIDRVLYYHRIHENQATNTTRADFFRSVNERRISLVPERGARLARVAESRKALVGVRALLSLGDAYHEFPAILLAGGANGRLRAMPGSVPWWDILAHERASDWIAYLGTSWLDIGALQGALRTPNSPLQGLVVSGKMPTSLHMARWYAGYLDFLILMDPVAETALYSYLPDTMPVIIGRTEACG
jgi:hypothetical protein